MQQEIHRWRMGEVCRPIEKKQKTKENRVILILVSEV